MTKPKTVRLRYAGGLPVTIYLPTGRVLDLEHGETYEFLPAEAEALADRPDFSPEED